MNEHFEKVETITFDVQVDLEQIRGMAYAVATCLGDGEVGEGNLAELTAVVWAIWGKAEQAEKKLEAVDEIINDER